MYYYSTTTTTTTTIVVVIVVVPIYMLYGLCVYIALIKNKYINPSLINQ